MQGPPIHLRNPKAQLAQFTRPRQSAVRSSGGGRVELTLSLPPRAASHNHQRGKWRESVRAKRALREEACMAALVARVQGVILKSWWGAKAELRFFVADKYRRDPANLLEATKGFFDGFVDAGLLRDDDHVLTAVVDDIQRDGEARTEILLLERTPADA